MTLLSVPAYAARHGVSKVAAYKWKAKGWLVLEDAQVNVEKSDLLLAMYRDPSDARAARGVPKPRSVAPPAPPALQVGVFDHAPGIQAGYEARMALRPGEVGGEAFKSAVQQAELDGRTPEEAAAQIASLLAGNASTEEARRVKENYLALRGKLEYERDAGSLIDVAQAESVMFEEARAVRNTWLNWPMKFGALIAADLGLEADRITEVLTGYVHKQVASLGEPDATFGR